jgi:hypothetical protein
VAAPTIASVYPGDEATGVVLSDVVYVIFDQEVDHSTVQIIVEGPDTDRVTGPDLTRWDDPTTTSDDEILESPAYKGIVAGTLTFVAVDDSGEIYSGAQDYTGSGNIWRTKAIFTPDIPFGAMTEFRVYIIGDEESTDDLESGVSSRTVFDVQKGANLGTGEAYFRGGYSGTINNKYNVEITETGDAGDVHFKWWKDSAPLIIRELKTSLSSILLDNGVYVRFEGALEDGDTYSVVVKPGVRMANTYTWTFTTGSGSILAVPAAADTSYGITDLAGATSSDLRIVSVTPAERATNLAPTDVEVIVIKFNKNLDDTTITDDAVTVWTEPVNGDTSLDAEGAIAKILTVSGDTLTIQIS